MVLKEELIMAKELAIKAGREIMKIYQDAFTVNYKEDDSPITDADRKSNEVIVEGLTRYFPDCPILSEESKDNEDRLKKDWCWIVDPLDGTKEFIKKNGEFTVNIALSYRGKAVLGVIYLPEKEEMYYAVKGSGAFYEANGITERMKVSNRKSSLILLKSRSHPDKRLDVLIDRNRHRISKIIPLGSSLKGCLIARGMADIYYRFGHTREWDIAPLQPIVEEAGGVFRDMLGRDITFNRKNTLNEDGFFILNHIDNKLL